MTRVTILLRLVWVRSAKMAMAPGENRPLPDALVSHTATSVPFKDSCTFNKLLVSIRRIYTLYEHMNYAATFCSFGV